MKLRVLYLVQLLDSKENEFNKEIKRLMEPTEAMILRDSLEKQKKEKEAQWKLTEATLKDKQLGLTALENKIKQQENKMTGGSITNAREAQDMESHVLSLKKDRDQRDEEILELMDQDDSAKGELLRMNQEIKKISLEIENEQTFIDDEIAKCRDLLKQVISRRTEVLEAVDAEELEMYQKLKKRKNGLAIVEIKSGSCGGCGVQLPDKISSAVYDDEEITNCPNCDRILVYDEENLASRLLSI